MDGWMDGCTEEEIEEMEVSTPQLVSSTDNDVKRDEGVISERVT